MAHVVAEPCVHCKYTDCVVICPHEAFYEVETMVVIHPDECTDCEACVSECPVDAIFQEDSLPAEWSVYRQLNADQAELGRLITEVREPLAEESGKCVDP